MDLNNAQKALGRPELVWPGKRREVDRVALPFQVVETINESRATREQTPVLAGLPPPPLFDVQPAPDRSWTNKLIWGDNKYVLASLLNGEPSVGREPLAGKIDLIYIDPPFATGADFRITMRLGDTAWTKEASLIEEKAYRDTWSTWPKLDSYLQTMYERLVLMRDLLSDTGSIYVHLDWHVGHYVKLIMDEIFGQDSFHNEVIWRYRRWPAKTRSFQKMHDLLFVYVKSPDDSHIFNQLYEELAPSTLETWGTKKQVADFSTGRRKPSQLDAETSGAPMADVWDIGIIAPISHERLGFETQKPEALLERIIKASSNKGALVADFFCGSGTTMAVAERLGRRWIGCDLSRYAINVTRKRMLNIADCRPFEVLNLGKYERRHWQVNVLNGEQENAERAVADYLRFIVALYHAEPVGGHTHLHGQKAGRWVHVGATDAPVTRNEVMGAVRECQRQKYTGLDVLGWEWEMGLHDTIRDDGRRHGVDVRLLVIPREVMDKRAVEAGDVHFYELAYLKTSVLQDRRTVTVRLDEFIIPNPDLVPDEVRSKVKKWSDYIDFWAVDWNYKGDTFHNEWQTYRTRKSPTLRLLSDPHTYDKGGVRRVLVKVIDIFGNDTTHLLEVNIP